MTRSGGRPHPLWELTKARIREFFREPGVVFWVFGFPLLMALGLGLAFRERPAGVPKVGVVSAQPGATLTTLVSSQKLEARHMTRTEADRALARSKLDLVVDLDAAKPVLRFHPNQDNARLARLVVTDVMQRAAGRSDPVVLAEALVTERGSRYIDFLLPGLIGLNLMGGSMWGVGYNLVVARKRRLLRRYAVTPMRRTHFLLSYFFSRSLFFTAELGVLLAFGALVFGTHVRGSYLAFGVLAYVGAAAFAGISLLIGSRVSSSEVANGWMNVVQLPMWLLSGAFFSYERFPEWLHGAIRLLPLTALVDSLRAVANEGASITQCWSELLTMGAWGAAGFVVALRTFRWQ